jgi:hypothetical protein
MVMKNSMKKVGSKKSFWVSRSGKVAIAAGVTVGLFSFGAVGARAGLLEELKNLAVIVNSLGQYLEVAKNFSLPSIKKFTDIFDVSAITGVQGQFAPEEGKKMVDNNFDAKNLLSATLKKGFTSTATSNLAADQVLSKQAQAATEENKKKIADLDKSTVDLADKAWAEAQEADGKSSSQDVLKIMSYQLSRNADINAAQVRLSVLQNNSSVEANTQLAASNATNADRAEREMGERQAKALREGNDALSILKSNSLNYNQKLF